jgi:hypothetical protein
MGPLGIAQALFLRLALWASRVFEQLSAKFGPMIAGCIICGGVAIAGMFGMMFLAILFVPKAKED